MPYNGNLGRECPCSEEPRRLVVVRGKRFHDQSLTGWAAAGFNDTELGV